MYMSMRQHRPLRFHQLHSRKGFIFSHPQLNAGASIKPTSHVHVLYLKEHLVCYAIQHRHRILTGGCTTGAGKSTRKDPTATLSEETDRPCRCHNDG